MEVYKCKNLKNNAAKTVKLHKIFPLKIMAAVSALKQ